MATTDRVLEETVNGEVTRVLEVDECDDGLVVHLEVLEHPDDPARRVVSRCEVEVDEDRQILGVTRRPGAG